MKSGGRDDLSGSVTVGRDELKARDMVRVANQGLRVILALN